MKLQVNQIAFGLGPGVLGATANRMGVWTQGCSLIKCPGCASRHSWPGNGGKVMSIEALIRLARQQPTRPSGLTVSGGEPTDQPASVMALIDGFQRTFPEGEVVLYTGLPWRTLTARHPLLVALLDVAVTGPYVRALEPTPMAGSSNQEVHLLTPLAERLYRDWRNWPIHALQVGRGAGDQVVTVGIPDIPRMEMAAQQAGGTEASWNKTNLAKEWRKS